MLPGFSESESDTGNNIPSMSNDTLGISYRKNWKNRFMKNMWQSASDCHILLIYLVYRFLWQSASIGVLILTQGISINILDISKICEFCGVPKSNILDIPSISIKIA